MKTVILAVVVFAAISLAESGKNHKFMCKGTEIKFSEDTKKIMATCWDELKGRMKGTGDDSKAHYKPDDCFAACKMEKTKVVVDGKVDTAAFNKAVEAAFPSEVQTALKDAFKKCADAVEGKLSTDDSCKSYSGLSKCYMDAIKTNCKNANEDDA